MADHQMPDSLPCLRHDEPEVYHNIQALTAGRTGALLRSIGHFSWGVRNRWAQGGGTPAMVLGSLVHSMVLEPETVSGLYVVKPEFGRKKDDLEAKSAWEAANADRIVITAEQQDTAHAMGEALRTHDGAMLALTGRHEISAYWMQHDVPCRARFDCLGDGFGADLKTAGDASPTGFAKACANLGYHRTAAHYLDAYEAVTGERPAGYLFVAVESSPPHAIGVYELDEADIDLGRRQVEKAAARFRQYLDARANENDRPIIRTDYTEGVQRINLPAWAHYQEEA